MKTKTIIITAVPSGRGPLGIAAAAPRLLSQGQSPPSQAQQPRKRERLTHLTAEEKLNRRKLKNRIAAQTARDRKKARMANLEETTTDLQADNDALIVENETLRQQNADLAAENARLRAALETGGGSGDSGKTLGSAVGTGLCQRASSPLSSGDSLESILSQLLDDFVPAEASASAPGPDAGGVGGDGGIVGQGSLPLPAPTPGPAPAEPSTLEQGTPESGAMTMSSPDSPAAVVPHLPAADSPIPNLAMEDLDSFLKSDYAAATKSQASPIPMEEQDFLLQDDEPQLADFLLTQPHNLHWADTFTDFN